MSRLSDQWRHSAMRRSRSGASCASPWCNHSAALNADWLPDDAIVRALCPRSGFVNMHVMLGHRRSDSCPTKPAVADIDRSSSVSEFNKLIGQSHQFVLDLRILAPGCNFQKLYHDPFQARALLAGQPASGSGLACACHTHSTAAILAVVFSP
jgi:hypothetical protein